MSFTRKTTLESWYCTACHRGISGSTTIDPQCLKHLPRVLTTRYFNITIWPHWGRVLSREQVFWEAHNMGLVPYRPQEEQDVAEH